MEEHMSHVFHQLYYHFTWATHSREPLVDRVWRPRLLDIINEEVQTRGGFPIRQNAMPDHAHLLCRLPPTILIAEFIGQVKGATSFRVNKEIRPRFKLHWQEGYGVVTLRKDEIEKVSRYIDRQEEHHRRGSVSELLERCEIEEDDALEKPPEGGSVESNGYRDPGVNAWASEKSESMEPTDWCGHATFSQSSQILRCHASCPGDPPPTREPV